jgi:hypothetical protein
MKGVQDLHYDWSSKNINICFLFFTVSIFTEHKQITLWVVYSRCKCPAHAHPGTSYGVSNILDLRSHASSIPDAKPSKDYAFEVRRIRS